MVEWTICDVHLFFEKPFCLDEFVPEKGPAILESQAENHPITICARILKCSVHNPRDARPGSYTIIQY